MEDLTVENYSDLNKRIIEDEAKLNEKEVTKHNARGEKIFAESNGSFRMSVPGLAVGWPSIRVGNRMRIKRSDHLRGKTFLCKIKTVRHDDIIFGGPGYIRTSSGWGEFLYDVEFEFNAARIERLVDTVKEFFARPDFCKIAFPEPATELKSTLIEIHEEDLHFYDARIGENVDQKKAVLNILRASQRPAPYLISGPPGTGKTTTLIEAVLQVHKHNKEAKILVCAKFDERLDKITTKILETYADEDIEQDLLRFASTLNGNISDQLARVTKCFIDYNPISRHKILCTAPLKAGRLQDLLKEDRFDYVFIDDANGDLEYYYILPINLVKHGGCCILAGDPQGTDANYLDGKYLPSILERLSKREVYQRGVGTRAGYDERYITRLNVNYRSDARLLAVCNAITYKDAPMEFGRQEAPDWLLQGMEVNSPTIFHQTIGDCLGDDPRIWFNSDEAQVCVDYVERLYSVGLEANQVGIITQYRYQISEIESYFKAKERSEPCKIDTVEYFQWEEKEVIIISTVQSRNYDRSEVPLGLRFDERRFNVAISRAKWMTIVVGDEEILKQSEHFAMYLDKSIKL